MIQVKTHPALPFDATAAEIMAARYEDEATDWGFRRPILKQLPDRFAFRIASHYAELYQSEGRRIANLYMLDVQDDLSRFTLSLAASNDDLIAAAKNAAERCRRLRYIVKTEAAALYALTHFITSHYKLHPNLLTIHKHKSRVVTVSVTDAVKDSPLQSVTDTVTVTGILNRLCDDYWWRRTLRNVHIRNVEKHAIQSGFVQRNAGLYISDEGFKRYLQQQQSNVKTLEQCTALNETTGFEASLLELAQHSLANPSNRRAELMVRIKGFEEISKELGNMAMFYTITCPSRMHAYKTKTLPSGKVLCFPNAKYDQTTPKEAQAYLAAVWTRVRSKFKRDGLKIYGFRVTEAHHDGTPHWHMLLFMNKEHETAITQIIRDYALQEDANEEGAAKYRFKAENIDPKKGSATGYIAKYITKGLDGYGLDEDLYGEEGKKSAHRVRAWASTWGVRQFQQLGGPPVTIYREMRRIQGRELNGLIEQIRQAADTGNWQSFVKLLGGPTLERKDYVVTVARQWNDKPNRYQEPSGYQIIGVDYGKLVITTRIHQWTIQYRRKAEKKSNGRDGIAYPANEPPCNAVGFNKGFLAPWSSVNNCTESFMDALFWP